MPYSTTDTVKTLTGNGSANTLALPWPIYDTSHVVVKKKTAADTALTTLVITTDYSISVPGDEEDGGTLTLVSTPAVGEYIYAYLDIPNTQATRYKSGSNFSPAALNEDLDKLVLRVGMLDEMVKRAWRLPVTNTGDDMECVIEKATLLGKLAQFNSSTGRLEGVQAASVSLVTLNAALSAINALTPAANKLPYYTSGSQAALADFLAAAGTWTPVLTFATPGDLSIAYTHQVGRYLRIGSLIVAWFSIQTSTFTHTTASGAASITGLPVTSLNVVGLISYQAMGWSGITKANYTHMMPQISANSTTISLIASGSGQAITTVNAADMPTGGSVVLRGVVIYAAA